MEEVVEEVGHLLRVQAIGVIGIILVEDLIDVAPEHFILELLAPYHMYIYKITKAMDLNMFIC